MIRVGPAGWKYKDWEGIVYPKPKPRGFDELAYIASFFNTVEINTSFYGPPKIPAVQAWLESVGNQREFRFTAKLYRGFTHTKNAKPEEERDFRQAMRLLMEAERLGAVLMQFPWSFQNDAESRGYLAGLVRKLNEFPLVLEVRHASWITDGMLNLFAEWGVGICNIDQPLFKRSVKPSALATSRVGYVRLHGRNYRNWFSAQADVRERYDYLYSTTELNPWVDRIRAIERDTEEVYVVTNNHNLGKAATNAVELRSVLEGAPIRAPETLVIRYPELREPTK